MPQTIGTTGSSHRHTWTFSQPTNQYINQRYQFRQPDRQYPVLREMDRITRPLIHSVQDNRDSPRLLVPLQQGASQESNNSWVAPPSVVADSQPDNDISIADYCSPTRVLEHFLQRRGSPSTQSQGLSGTEYPVSEEESAFGYRKAERCTAPATWVTSHGFRLPSCFQSFPGASPLVSPVANTSNCPAPRGLTITQETSPPVDQVPSSEARPDSGSQVVIPYSL